jgi:hypothetical protein
MRYQVTAAGIQVEFETLDEAKLFAHTLPKGTDFRIRDQQALQTNPVVYHYGVSGTPQYVTRGHYSPFTLLPRITPKSKPR